MRNFIDIVNEALNQVEYSEQDMIEIASGYMRGMGATDHPEAIKSEYDYDWRYEPNYPISRLNPSVDKVKWMREEIEMWSEEGQPDRYDDEIKGPIREPIIAVETDGGTHTEIVDGWHRTGASALAGRDTIPAIIGILKK